MPTFSLREQRIQTICLLIISAILLATALYWLRPVMIPFVLAVFCVLALSMLVDTLQRRLRFPYALALVTSLLAAVLSFLAIALIVTSSVRELARKADTYKASVATLIENLANNLTDELAVDPTAEAGESGVELSPPASWLRALGVTKQDFKSLYEVPASNIAGMLLGTTNALLEIISRSFLVLIFVLFLLLGGMRANRRKNGVWAVIESRIKRYLVTKVAISTMTGFLVGTVLAILNVDLAVAFGLLAFLLNFIPSVGSIIATMLPLPLVLVGDYSTSTVILVILIPGTIQISVGNFLEPKIMGDYLDLHPVAILVSLIFWGMLWGIVGMFLAVPMTAILQILMNRFEYTKPLASLLAGQFERLSFPEFAEPTPSPEKD